MSPPTSIARRRHRHVVLQATIAVALAACGTGGLPPASSPGVPAETPAAATPAAATPVPATRDPDGTPTGVPSPGDVTPAPTEVAGPPLAALAGLAATGGPQPGALGTFTWDGLTSDAPWIVPSVGRTAAAGALLEVTFLPSIAPSSWVARWAPVTGSTAGDPVPAGQGGPGPVRLVAPGAGAWSLQVEARFGEGRNGAWYWRVDVMP